jgi:hypothetical protein
LSVPVHAVPCGKIAAATGCQPADTLSAPSTREQEGSYAVAFFLKKKAEPGATISSERSFVPEAPGAVWSPQVPGQVPDRSTVPGEGVLPVPVPEVTPRRPLTEYGTAQRIMHVYAPKDGNDDDPARFEQAPVSYEELRKATPALRQPLRPHPGYALVDGTRLPSAAIAALQDPAALNEIAPGE